MLFEGLMFEANSTSRETLYDTQTLIENDKIKVSSFFVTTSR